MNIVFSLLILYREISCTILPKQVLVLSHHIDSCIGQAQKEGKEKQKKKRRKNPKHIVVTLLLPPFGELYWHQPSVWMMQAVNRSQSKSWLAVFVEYICLHSLFWDSWHELS